MHGCAGKSGPLLITIMCMFNTVCMEYIICLSRVCMPYVEIYRNRCYHVIFIFFFNPFLQHSLITTLHIKYILCVKERVTTLLAASCFFYTLQRETTAVSSCLLPLATNSFQKGRIPSKKGSTLMSCPPLRRDVIILLSLISASTKSIFPYT